MAKKTAAMHLVVAQGLCADIETAGRLIMAGQVYVIKGEHRELVHKAGELLPTEATLVLKRKNRFVSRGGYKLLTAIEAFSLDFSGAVALDAGASTGGFTDCLLQHGAAKVYAIDVGKNQLHEKLRADPRVVSLEGVNLRLAPATLIAEQVDVIVADVSFISLMAVLEPCLRWLRPDGLVAALIKPQFEVAADQTCKGVVTNPEVRQAAVDKVAAEAAEHGLALVGVVPSALKGPKGNQEYMAVWQRRNDPHAE